MIRTQLCFFALLGAVRLVSAQTPTGQQIYVPGVLAADSTIELVRGGFQRLEGPVATKDGGLYFSDIDQNRTYKLDADGKISVWRENTNGANGLLMLNDGRLLAAECGCSSGNTIGGRITAVMPDGGVTSITSQFKGKPLMGPNDLIADKKGGIYFTDPGPRFPPNVAPNGHHGNVHYIRSSGDVLVVENQMVYPNGITLSLDEKTLFVDDTFGEYVYAFDVQPDGRVKNKRQFVKLREPEQWPPWGFRSRADGMAIDSEGRLYVATVSGVQVINPTGQYLGTIRAPAIIRNLAFAGPGHKMLYMTALESLYRIQMLAKGPSGRAK